MIIGAITIAMIAVAPTQAQTKKQKKEWKTEEAQLLHEQKMDSIRNAQKVATEKAAKAEAERRAAEAKAEAEKKKAEAAAALEEKEFNEPCMEFESTASLIRARGIGEDFEQQLSVEMARSAAIEELASQLSTKVQALLMNYKKSVRQNLKRESIRRVEGLTMTSVDQNTGYRISCRKTMTYEQNGERIFKTYLVVELGEDMLLKPIYDGIQKDEELKIDQDYQAFKKEFDEHFKNKSEEALQEIINQ